MIDGSPQVMPGLDLATLEIWMANRIPDARAPFRYSLIAGGHSNLTYRIDDDRGARYVLRRPPMGATDFRAHDMAREFKIYAALGATSVPVPQVEAFCDDVHLIGAAFYVMRWVEGCIVDSPVAAARTLPTRQSRLQATLSLVNCLADLHQLDVDRVGLGDLGPREGYVRRQLDRMHRTWEKTKTRELPIIDTLYAELIERQPPQRYTGLVHGDYRLGNMMLSGDAQIVAVLDWELCALGDVLTDIGYLVNSWDEPDDPSPGVWMQEAPTRAGEFPTREEVVAMYSRRSSLAVSDLNYYRAFGYWRIAIVAEGIKRRYESGAMASAGEQPQIIDRRVRARAELARHFLNQVV